MPAPSETPFSSTKENAGEGNKARGFDDVDVDGHFVALRNGLDVDAAKYRQTVEAFPVKLNRRFVVRLTNGRSQLVADQLLMRVDEPVDADFADRLAIFAFSAQELGSG